MRVLAEGGQRLGTAPGGVAAFLAEFRGRTRLRLQLGNGRRFGVDLLTPSFLQVAEAFDIWHSEVRQASEMGPILKEAIQQSGPALISIDMAAVGPMATPFTGSARLVPGR